MKFVKETINEDHHLDSNDESSNAQKHLSTICKNVENLKSLITDGKQLDAWVQSKLAIADSHIQEISNYIEAETDQPEVLEPTVVEPDLETPSPEGELEIGIDTPIDSTIDDISGEEGLDTEDDVPEGEFFELTDTEDIFNPKNDTEEVETEEEIDMSDEDAVDELEGETAKTPSILGAKIQVKESLDSYFK